MLFKIMILVDIWAGRKAEYLVWASSCVIFHLDALLAAWQSCFSCFLTAKELMLISLLSKVKLGLAFGHSHLLLAFPDPTVFCANLSFFLLSFLVLSVSQLGHVSSNEINEGPCNFESVLIVICTTLVASEFIHDYSVPKALVEDRS